MEKFVIQGGKPLNGIIEARGAKNAAFPILAATLLTSESCVIDNLPLIEDIFRFIELLKSIGAEVSWLGERTVEIRAKNIDPTGIKKCTMSKLRGSVLLYGPLLSRFGKIEFPQPGGCLIGARPIDTHIDAFMQMGAKCIIGQELCAFELKPKRKVHTEIILNEFSVTGTENVLLLASLLPEKTVIKIADQDYQVQELCRFLKKMGVIIKGEGTHTITVKGKRKLTGAKHCLMYDPIEAGTLIIAAAASRGTVVVKNAELSFLSLPLKKLRDSGVPLEVIGKNSLKVKPWKSLKIGKIQSFIYPGIPSDLQSIFGILATQANGLTLMHDPLYEGRLKYLEELAKMGAKIIFADPHRAIIEGPVELHGTDLRTLDLRGGASFIIAGLIAKGKTVIDNIYQIDRGYEKIEERLCKLGADIKRIKD